MYRCWCLCLQTQRRRRREICSASTKKTTSRFSRWACLIGEEYCGCSVAVGRCADLLRCLVPLQMITNSRKCCTCSRAVNADLFRAADLSFSVESLPLNQPLSSLPVAAASCFSAIDAAFNSSIVGLHTALPLGDLVRNVGDAINGVHYLINENRFQSRDPFLTEEVPSMDKGFQCDIAGSMPAKTVSAYRLFDLYSQVRRGGAIGGLDEVGSIIIDLVREGRRLLTNTYQVE